MTFYEQVGIVIPGSVFLVGLLFYFPALKVAGGMPTDWITKATGTSLLSASQTAALEAKVNARFG